MFNMTVFLSYISLELMSLVNPGIFSPIPYLLIVTLFFAVVERCNAGELQQAITTGDPKDEPPDEPQFEDVAELAVTVGK